MCKEIILVGNPNTGKTTLFNMLTKSNDKVSNWHGVTVGSKSKKCSLGKEEYIISDTPGIYSLSGYSNEEKIAIKFLEEYKNELIINVCDVNNLKRNLILTKDLIMAGYNIIVIVNMTSACDVYDYKMLSKLLGVSVINIDARNKKDGEKLLNIVNKIQNKKTQKSTNINKNKYLNINIEEIMLYSIKNTEYNPYKNSDKIDKFILNKWIFLSLFIEVVFLIFYITFGPVGKFISSVFNNIFNNIFTFLRKIIYCTNISNIIKLFICDGVFVGIESVVSFVPQILLLMYFLNLLEDTGFMSRVAFMFDGLLKKIGLTGKSLFSLMMGYGCTTSAIITTRNLENKKLQKRTIMLLPFASCSAKLPIFLVVSSLFFERYKFLIIFLLYVFAIIISIIFACIYKRFVPDKENIFILEMPKYRLPNIMKISKDAFSILKEFLIKIGTTIVFFTSIVWILQNFTIKLQFLNGEYFEESILYYIAKRLTFLFKPIGLGNEGVVVALFFGLIAKEMIVVGLAMINGVGIGSLTMSLLNPLSICSFSLISSIVFLVFIVIYSPCMSSIIAIKNEMGTKFALYVFITQFLLAYLISYLIFKLFTDYRFIFALGLFFVLAILLDCVLKLNKNNKCRGNCNACRRI